GEAPEGDVEAVRLERADLRAQDVRQDAESAAAVRERAALAPRRDQPRPLVELAVQLPDQPALPHAGRTDERHELQRTLARGAVDRVDEQTPLGIATDEGGTAVLRHVDAVAGARPQRFGTLDRSGFPLRFDGRSIPILDCALRRSPRG